MPGTTTKFLGRGWHRGGHSASDGEGSAHTPPQRWRRRHGVAVMKTLLVRGGRRGGVEGAVRVGVQEFWWRTFNAGALAVLGLRGGGWWSMSSARGPCLRSELPNCGHWHEAGLLAPGGGPSGLRTPQPRLEGAGRGVGRAGGACPGLQGEGGGSTETHPQSGKGPGTGHWCQTRGTALARKWPKNGTARQFLRLRAHAPQKRPRAGGLGGVGAATAPGGSAPGRAGGSEAPVLQRGRQHSARAS